MLSNIVTAALAQVRDFVVVGNIREHEDLSSQIRKTSADAIIVQARQPGTAESFVPLLRSFPALIVVEIGPSGSGFVHQLHPRSIRITELSADALQSVLRIGSGWSRIAE